MNIAFRPVRRKDIEILKATYAGNGLSHYSSRFTPVLFSTRGLVKSPGHCWLAILAGKKLIGSIWVEKKRKESRTGKLGILIHQKSYWSRGIGEYAIVKLAPIFKRRLSISRIVLNVRCKNIRAIRCYEKCGFAVLRRNLKRISGGVVPYFTMVMP